MKSFRTAVLIFTTLMLMAAAAAVANAQVYTDIFNFDGTNGASPYYPNLLAQGRDGNLYATTPDGGAYQCVLFGENQGCGVVFKITLSGAPTVLYNFDGAVDGSVPFSGLTLSTDGNLYGTTYQNGSNGDGTIFKITPSGHLTTLYSFTDGGNPFAPPIQATDGNFYGTTRGGTAYKITSSGVFSSLGSLPASSYAPLVQATDGNFYGTTVGGGGLGGGTVFEMTPKGMITIVYNFDGPHGSGIYSPVIQGSDGNLYGTTQAGGNYGQGVVFKLTPQGAITLLHSFPDPHYLNDGSQLWAGLVQATDGNFYGATYGGGTNGNGVIFQITPAGVYSILYNFDYGYGGYPLSTPMQHTNGTIYGTTWQGGSSLGVVYSFDMGLAPFVSFVLPVGKVGKTVEILGQGFTGTGGVSFNGTAADFKVISDTFLGADVPNGAETGSVTVTTPTGTLTSNVPFRVTPQLLNFNPPSGPVGTLVTITGVSLTQTTGVGFGDYVPAQFTVNSDTQVTATVPTGARTGRVGIQTLGGIALSSSPFTVTK